MPIVPRSSSLAVAFLLVAGCASPGNQGFPDLLPRPHEVPRVLDETATAPAGLAEAERAALGEEIVRAEAALDAARREAAAASEALAPALARARGAPAGSDAWADAQLALSRLDQARAGYGEIAAMLAPLVRLVDPAPADDPDRLRLERLLASVRAEAEALAALQERAARQLG